MMLNSRDIDDTFNLFEWDDLQKMVNKTVNEIIDLFKVSEEITETDFENLMMYLSNKIQNYAN